MRTNPRITTLRDGRAGLSLVTAALVVGLLVAGAASAVTVDVLGVPKVGTPSPIAGGFRWTIEEDRTYHVQPGVPDPNTLSVSLHPSYMPVRAAGDETDLAAALAALDATKHYFISVIPKTAGSWALGGAQISPADIAGGGTVPVYLHELPLPTAQIRIMVFEDNQPVNNAPDYPEEEPDPADCPGPSCMAGFSIILEDAGGRYGISSGVMMADAFGNPLGTTYLPSCPNPADPEPCVDALGNGIILTDANGIATVKNLSPGKYGTKVTPPAGLGWVQTATIEGTKVIDAWVKANEPAYFMEFGPPGPHAAFGFVRAPGGSYSDPTVLTGGKTVSGKVTNLHLSRPPDYAFYDGETIGHSTAWVGLNLGPAGTGRAVAMQRCNGDGTFSIANVPAGDYQLVVWDDALDVIFAFQAITVPAGPGAMNLGDVPVFQWFTRTEHYVFYDTDGDGYRDPGEVPISDQAVNVRWRDGTMYQSSTTDMDGYYGFDEVFPFFAWLVAEVDYLRFKATGVTITIDNGGPIDPTDPLSWGGQLNPQPQCLPGIFYDPLTGLCPVGQEDINPNTGHNLQRTETGPVLTQGFQGFLGQTSVFEWGKQAYPFGENGGISGIVFYDTTRAENDPRFNFGEPFSPAIPRVQVNLYRDSDDNSEIDDINGEAGVQLADIDYDPLGWSEGGAMGAEDVDRNGNSTFDLGDALEITHTDSWDDNPPTGCQGELYSFRGSPKDCLDGLRTFNQVRPAVFDGGYAFGTAAGGVLAAGIYIVETVQPPGYEIVKEQDKNVDFGEDYLPSPLALPMPCVNFDDVDNDGFPGQKVPAELDLFPGIPAASAGLHVPLCDRKQVKLSNGQNAAADFFLFTKAPVAGHIYGFILDDVSNEFDPAAPSFGEKFAPPWLPVSIQDWTGREIARTYSDEYGVYNSLVPSTFTANQPKPSGWAPSMLTVCLNGPTKPDPNNPGSFIPDEFHNPQYSQFCYTFQYMPGTTTYLDTPVVPIAAMAGPGQLPLDCQFPTQTPRIHSVTDSGQNGPWVSAADGTQQLTIMSLGDVQVLNPAFEGVGGTEPKNIVRDYGFGAQGPASRVTIGGVALTIDTWTNASITATVPAGVTTGQLVVTRSDSGKNSINAVTVTVGGATPRTVKKAGGDYSTIQAAIDDTANVPNGGLLTIGPGVYDELVVLWRPLRLQGWGAGSVTINAIKTPAEKLQAWRDKVAGLITSGAVSLLPGQTINPGSPVEPDILFTEEGPAIAVLAQNTTVGTGGFGLVGSAPNARIDGLAITGADHAGGIFVNGYAHFLQISNNRIYANAGFYDGGIRLGHPTLTQETPNGIRYVNAQNDGIRILNNHIHENGGQGGAGGGVSLCTGSTGYEVSRNWICGNFSLGDGGGIGHLGLSHGGRIAHNNILFNENFNQGTTVSGGGIFIAGAAPNPAGGLSEGSGSVQIVGNLIQGNLAGVGDGGGIRILRANGLDVQANRFLSNAWYAIDIFNNMIVDNISGLAGGGIALEEAVRVSIRHNTVSRNDSTATAGQAFQASPGGTPYQTSTPQPAGIVSRANSDALYNAIGNRSQRRRFVDPTLETTIVRENRSFYFAADGTFDPPCYKLFPDLSNVNCDGTPRTPDAPVFWDLGVLVTNVPRFYMSPRNCILDSLTEDGASYHVSNLTSDPAVVRAYYNGNRGATLQQPETTTAIQAPVAFDEGGNFIKLRFGPLTLNQITGPNAGQAYGDYHLTSTSPAIGAGLPLGTRSTPIDLRKDFDLQTRPNPVPAGSLPDIGADEYYVPGTPVIRLFGLDPMNFDQGTSDETQDRP